MFLTTGPVLVGVQPDQAPAVIETAAQLAHRMHSTLVCIEADPDDAYLGPAAGIGAYGFTDVVTQTTVRAPEDQDDADRSADDRALRARISEALHGTQIEWTLDRRRGNPFDVLAQTAEEIDASLIVVGTREAGFGHAVLEFFTGSIATRLAHGQRRPVVVVPLAPLEHDDQQPSQRPASTKGARP